MRTNIDIDDKLMKQAMKATGTSTKRAAVEAALLKVVQLKRQEGIKKLRGKVQWVGDLDAMREGRFVSWEEESRKKKPKKSAA